MYHALWFPQDYSRRAGKRWRIQQIAIVDAYRADRRVDSKPESHRMSHPSPANIRHTPEHVSKIIKRNQPQLPAKWKALFEIDDNHRVPADWNQCRELLLVLRFENALRAGLVESKTAQGCCPAGEEALADRQQANRIRGDPALIPEIEWSGQSHSCCNSQHGVSQDRGRTRQRPVMLVARKEFIERYIAADLARSKRVLKAYQLPFVRIQSRIATVIRKAGREHPQQDRLLVGCNSQYWNILSIKQSRVLEIVAKIESLGFRELPLGLDIGSESLNTITRTRADRRRAAPHQPHLHGRADV